MRTGLCWAWVVLPLWVMGCERGARNDQVPPMPPDPTSVLRPSTAGTESSSESEADVAGPDSSAPEVNLGRDVGMAGSGLPQDGGIGADSGQAFPEDFPGKGDSPRWLRSEPVCTIMGRDVKREPEVIGADLGISYTTGEGIEWLFGDTWATERPPTNNDDAYATLKGITDGRMAERVCQQEPLPLELGADGEGNLLPITAGPVLDGFKAPVTGFAWGQDEYAIFSYFKPRGCVDDEDCPSGLSCALALGYMGVPPSQESDFTLPCKDGSAGCTANPINGTRSGLCVDETLQRGGSDGDLVASASMHLRFGVRSKRRRNEYSTQTFVTTRFQNVTAVVVDRDYRVPRVEGEEGGRALLFGRPGFLGTESRPLPLYLAYVELPWSGGRGLELHFFAGLDAMGQPIFSELERDSVALDLAGGKGDPIERHDVINQSSIRYIPELGRWIMLYGGGISTMPRIPLVQCGVAEIFAPADCTEAKVGNGAIRVRWAFRPWGPWSLPEDVMVAGEVETAKPTEQYGPGGVLRHPRCTAQDCAPHQGLPNFVDEEYGFFYAPNIIEPWVWSEDGRLHIYWNVSTWDPYRIVLMKSSFLLPVEDGVGEGF